jgi:hypothetical protein
MSFDRIRPRKAEWWNPTPENRIRELQKAWALIAAEIDRLQRYPRRLRAVKGQSPKSDRALLVSVHRQICRFTALRSMLHSLNHYVPENNHRKPLNKCRRSNNNVLMKINENPQQIQSINQSFRELRRISLVLVSAIVMTFLALSGKAANILVNPSFNTTLFGSGGWTQHAGQNWMSDHVTAQDGTSIKLIRTGADALWMQGQYNAANQDSYVSETFATFPGNVYAADAWYSTYTFQATNRLGGAATAASGGVNYYSGLFDGTGVGAQSDGWVEVKFFGSSNNLIADYKSKIVDPALTGAAATTTLPFDTYTGTLPITTNALGNIFLNWMDMPVTNQYDISTVLPNTDPDSETITNTLGSGQNIVAPAGAVTVEFGIHFFQANNNPDGAAFWDDATFNQIAGPSPSVITPTPDGTQFFNAASTNFTFNVTSASTGGAPLPTNSTSSVGIVVNGVNQTGNLQFSGPSTNLAVILQGFLASNSPLISISISVTNSVGLISTKNVKFDTFPTNVFIVSAEDYDFTNGQFFQNPTPTPGTNTAPNSYSGTSGVLGVDMSTYNGTGTLPGNGAAQLIRTDGHTAMQKAADLQLPLYSAQSNVNVYNVQIAYNNGGNWLNYTRSYPTGNYLVYLRYNNGTAGNVESLNVLTSGYGTSTQTTNNLGEFIGANTGAGYAWTPLTDPFGNAVIVNLSAGTNTLQLLSGPGGGIANFVDFIFVPAGTNFPPFIKNLSPIAKNPPNFNVFVNASNITFSVGSIFSTVASNNIQTLVNGVDVTSGATITGNNTNWNVSLPCPQNQIVTLLINATDANGLSNSVSESFDTFSQNNFMIEAVDFDFNGGQFIDNPVPTGNTSGDEATNSYFNGGINFTNAAVFNIDYDNTYDNEGANQGTYRSLDTGVACQPSPGDFVRSIFTNSEASLSGGVALDHNLGYVNAGQWENYTRTIPTNTYNIWARAGSGGGAYANEQLALVTSGQGTTNQTTQPLGTFASTTTSTWNNYYWNPVRDTNGNIATVSLGGVQTIRFTRGGNLNVHFFMFVPSVQGVKMTASKSGSNIQIKFPTVSGHSYTVLYNSTLTGGSWLPLSAAVPGDGTVQTVNDPVGVGPTQRFYKLQIQ